MSQNSNNNITLTHLLHLCLRRRRWFVASVTISLIIAVNYLITTPYLYTREATIMVYKESMGKNSTDKNSTSFNELGFVNQSNDLADVVCQFTSLDMMMEVARRLDPSLPEEDVFDVAQDLRKRLTVEAGDESNIIYLKYQDLSTEKANTTLSLIIQVFNDKWRQERLEMIQNTSRFIDSRLKLLEQDLNAVDDSISVYKSQYGITDLGDISDVYLQQQTQSDIELLKLSNQKAMAEYIRSLLDVKGSHYQLLLVNSGINNNIIEAQITQYNSLLLQLQNHMEFTSEENPMIINQQKELENLRKNILANIDNHIRTIDIQLMALRGYNSKVLSKIMSNPAQAKYLQSVSREQKVKESLYLFLLQKKEENELSVTYNPVPTKTIDIPNGSGKPTSPKRLRVLIAAVILGILIPMTVIFIMETMNETVRDRHDIENHGNIPFLGSLPLTKKKRCALNRLKNLKNLKNLKSLRNLSWRRESDAIVVNYGGQDLANEAFRVIRTRMEVINNTHIGSNVYMITSAGKETGKTYVGMNLAIVLAIALKRVLFIDADLRKGSASSKWGITGMGLADYLSGLTDDAASLLFHQEKFPTLHVLPSGLPPVNPTELLDGERLEELIGYMRRKYDYIIIDTPQANNLADTEIIARQADWSLNIIRAGMYKLSNLETLEKKEGEEPNHFVILNVVDTDDNYE